MKKIILITAILVIAGVAVWYLFLREPRVKATDGFLVNVDQKGVILDGYDPVAYFTKGEPVKGNENYSTVYKGARYRFASAEHAAMFEANPEKYAPLYGAFCGYAVSIGKLRPVDPAIFQIEDGRLILQHTQDAYRLFNKHLMENKDKADRNWPGIVSKHTGKTVQYDEPAAPAVMSH